MTVPYSVNDNDVVLPADVNQYKKMIEGASGYTTTYDLHATANTDFNITLGDSAGVRKFNLKDSAGNVVYAIDSDGSTTSGPLTPSSLILPTSAAPSQTAEGSTFWDTDDDRLTVGTGAATKVIGLSREAGSNASATKELMYDTTAAALKVWDGSASQTVAPIFYNSLQIAFRTPRKRLAEFSAMDVNAADGSSVYMSMPVGVGFRHSNSASSTGATGSLTNLLLEAYTAQKTGTTGTDLYSAIGGAGGNVVGSTAPNKNPRMLIRWFPGSSTASLTSTFAGFMAGGAAAAGTASGAFLRANTTGNLFFVTDQAGTETATDLGARPTALTSYEIETTDAGVTWTCRNVTTSTVVATHTTNVPTATVALGYVIGGISSAGDQNAFNLTYCEVDSGTVA